MSEYSIPTPASTINDKPLVGFHFAVVFFTGGKTANSIDMRFKKVSGITAQIDTTTYKEGGENLFTHRLPVRVSYNNLTLERGIVVDSPLNTEFNTAMSSLRLNPGDVLIALLDDDSQPKAAWLFLRTYPVKWSISDLDAGSNSLVVETMELAYARYQVMRI